MNDFWYYALVTVAAFSVGFFIFYFTTAYMNATKFRPAWRRMAQDALDAAEEEPEHIAECRQLAAHFLEDSSERRRALRYAEKAVTREKRNRADHRRLTREADRMWIWPFRERRSEP